MAMVLWLLASIDASFDTETTFLEKQHTVLKVRFDDEGNPTRELTSDDLAKLPENVQSIMVAIGAEETALKSRADVETEVKKGDNKVVLGADVTVPVLLDKETVAELRGKLPATQTVSVKVRKKWGDRVEPKNLTAEEIAQRIGEDYNVELNEDVNVDTWWHSAVLTVPGIDVPLRWKALIVAVAFALCGFGIYKLLNKPRLADFLIESESELRRVDWPSKPEVVASTKVVVVVVVLMMVLLFVLDVINATLIKDGLFKIFLPKVK